MLVQPTNLAELFLNTEETGNGSSPIESEITSDLSVRLEGLPSVNVAAAEGGLSEAVRAMLDIKMTDILASAWSTLRELQEYLDSDRHPPDEIASVPLIKHTVKSTHHPSIEVLVGDSRVAEIKFDAEIAIAVDGVVLTVRDGRIWAAAGGKWRATGALKWEGQQILKEQTPHYPLPGQISFEQGIAIPKL